MKKFSAVVSSIVFTSVITLSNQAWSNCNFDNTTISFKANDESVASIIKTIEKQVGLTINIPNSKFLDNARASIAFYDTPLDLALKRLLKNTNYAITCDEKTSTLLLTLTGDRPAVPASARDAFTEVEMADVESPFPPDQRNTEKISPRTQEDLAKNNADYDFASPFPPERRQVSSSEPRPETGEEPEVYDAKSPFPPAERNLAALERRPYNDEISQSDTYNVDSPFAQDQRDTSYALTRSNSELSPEYTVESPFPPETRTN